MAWLSGYLHRKPITLTGGADGALTDYQLALAIAYVTDHMQTDFDDLRFTDADGNLIDAWLEEKTDDTSADVWVEFPTTPANEVTQTYYMYYGKADAVSDWDIGATFLFGDDFNDGSLDTNKWDTSGTVTEENGEVVGKISSKPTFDVGYAIRGRAKNAGASIYYFNWADAIAMGHWISYRELSGDWAIEEDGNHTSTGVATDGDYHVYDIGKLGTAGYFTRDGIDDGTLTSCPTSTANKLVQYTDDTYWDWALVRKYVANPPTYGFGSEQSPTGATPMGVFTGCFGRPLGGII